MQAVLVEADGGVERDGGEVGEVVGAGVAERDRAVPGRADAVVDGVGVGVDAERVPDVEQQRLDAADCFGDLGLLLCLLPLPRGHAGLDGGHGEFGWPCSGWRGWWLVGCSCVGFPFLVFLASSPSMKSWRPARCRRAGEICRPQIRSICLCGG